MKKLFVAMTVALGLVSSANLYAQSLELIPKAGINIGTQTFSTISGEKSRTSFQGGLGLNIHTGSKIFSIQPELNFIEKGVGLKDENNRTEKYAVNYLELPVLAKVRFGLIYLNAGPSLGLRLNQNDKSRAAIGNLKATDFGVQMGAGLAIPAGSGNIIIDGRYGLGLSNISDIADSKIKTEVFKFRLDMRYL